MNIKLKLFILLTIIFFSIPVVSAQKNVYDFDDLWVDLLRILYYPPGGHGWNITAYNLYVQNNLTVHNLTWINKTIINQNITGNLNVSGNITGGCIIFSNGTIECTKGIFSGDIYGENINVNNLINTQNLRATGQIDAGYGTSHSVILADSTFNRSGWFTGDDGSVIYIGDGTYGINVDSSASGSTSGRYYDGTITTEINDGTYGLDTDENIRTETLTLEGGSITDTTGTISFGDEDLTTTGHVGIGTAANANRGINLDEAVYAAGASQYGIYNKITGSGAGGVTYLVGNYFYVLNAHSSGTQYAAKGIWGKVTQWSNNRLNYAWGMDMTVDTKGSGWTGQIDYAYGAAARVSISNLATGTIVNAYNFYANIIDAEDGTITNGYNFYGKAPAVDAGGTFAKFAHIWLEDATVGDTRYGIVVDSDDEGIILGSGQEVNITGSSDGLDLNGADMRLGELQSNLTTITNNAENNQLELRYDLSNYCKMGSNSTGDYKIDPSGNSILLDADTYGNAADFTSFRCGGSAGLTGNYSTGICWMYFASGIMTGTNCTAY